MRIVARNSDISGLLRHLAAKFSFGVSGTVGSSVVAKMPFHLLVNLVRSSSAYLLIIRFALVPNFLVNFATVIFGASWASLSYRSRFSWVMSFEIRDRE